MRLTTTKKLLTPFILNMTLTCLVNHSHTLLNFTHSKKHNIENDFILLFLLLIQTKTPKMKA